MSTIEGVKTIDTHAFLGKSEVSGIPKDTGKYFSRPEFAGRGFLVIPFSAESNEVTLTRVAKGKPYLGMYVMFNPNGESRFHKHTDDINFIERLLPKKHVVGLKSLPSLYQIRMDDKRYDPYYQAAQTHRLPVLLHAAGSGQDYNSADMTKTVMDKFPDLRIILAHFGGSNPRYMEEAARLTEQSENLYLNTTGLGRVGRNLRFDLATGRRYIVSDMTEDAVEALRRASLDLFLDMTHLRPNQILLGTDMGWFTPEECSDWPIGEIKDPDIRQMILLQNPVRLFGGRMKPILTIPGSEHIYSLN